MLKMCCPKESTSLGVHIWTVVSLVGNQVSSSIHPSEYHAYSEAVERFEAAELGSAKQDRELRAILHASAKRGDYQQVHQYIEANASHLRVLQLAQHDTHVLSGYKVVASYRNSRQQPVRQKVLRRVGLS